jgi:hypothetical protein
MKDQIKGFMGVTIGTILGGEAIRQVGNIGSGMSQGLKSATQSVIGVGVLGNAMKFFKFK